MGEFESSGVHIFDAEKKMAYLESQHLQNAFVGNSALSLESVHSPWVVKVQRGDERSLTNLEKNTLARFKVDATTASATEEVEESYMEKVRINGKQAKNTNYRSMNHVSSTSNAVERLFSKAKLVITPQRRCMDPSTLEAIIMLRYNRDLWDIMLRYW